MNWKIFTTLFLSIFLSMLGQGIVVPLLPGYAYSLGATGLTIGFIFGAFSISRTIVLPYFGNLSDRKGRKPFIVLGLFFYSLVSIGYVISSGIIALIVIRFLQGIASAMILPVAQAYIGEITPLNREGSMMGFLNISLYAGLSAGPLAGGIMKDLFSIEISFVTMGILCLLGCLISIFFLPPRQNEQIRHHEKEGLTNRKLLKDRNVFAFFTFRLFHTLCIGAFWTFTPLLAHTEFNLSGLEIGTVITMSVLVSALLMVPMGMLADIMDRRYLIVSGGAAIIISMFFLSQLHSIWQLYAAALLIGIGGGISMPAILAMTVTLGKNKAAMGYIMSILTMGHSLGMLAGPVISGLLMDLIDYHTAFLGICITMMIVTLSTFFLTTEFPPAVDNS